MSDDETMIRDAVDYERDRGARRVCRLLVEHGVGRDEVVDELTGHWGWTPGYAERRYDMETTVLKPSRELIAMLHDLGWSHERVHDWLGARRVGERLAADPSLCRLSTADLMRRLDAGE